MSMPHYALYFDIEDTFSIHLTYITTPLADHNITYGSVILPSKSKLEIEYCNRTSKKLIMLLSSFELLNV